MVNLTKTILKIIVGLLIALNFLLNYWGLSSVLVTICFYFLSTLITLKAIEVFVLNRSLVSNLKLSAVVFFSLLFVGEVYLRYISKQYQSYQERSGSFFYSSPYIRAEVVDFFMNLIKPNATLFEKLANTPYDSLKNTGSEFGYTHYYNQLGLRGSLPNNCKGEIIIGLGDSFTEGLGTPEDSTWIALTVAIMNQKTANKRFCSLNGGLIGKDPVSELVVLKEILKFYHPSYVILAVNNTDIEDVMMKGGKERYDSNGNFRSRSIPWFDFFYSFSYIARHIAHNIFHYNYFLMTEERLQIEQKIARKKIYSLITEDYRRLAENHKFKLVVVLHPLLWELNNNDFTLEQYTNLRNENISVVNLFENFKQHQTKDNIDLSTLYWKVDGHHTPKGYALFAECISDSMINK
jgi:hypothetical protein